MNENESIEFKENYTEKIYKEIIAFLNTNSGTIYIGYDDNGNLIGVDNCKDIEEKISNGIRTNIYPDARIFVSINTGKIEDKEYIIIKVSKGIDIYYLKEKGIVKGTYLDTCLGDQFSISWMEHVDNSDRKENLEDQFNYLVKQVTKSHVSRYGDTSFKNDSIGEFIGFASSDHTPVEPHYSFKHWDSRDNKLLFLRYKADHSSGVDKEKWESAVKEELNHRSSVDKYFSSLTSNPRYYQYSEGVKDFNCYKRAIAEFTSQFGMSDYGLKYFSVFANMCNEDRNAF